MRAPCVLLLLVTLLAPFAWSEEELPQPQPVPEPSRAENGKWGFCTGRSVPDLLHKYDWSLRDGKAVIPARFAWVSCFEDGLARVTEEGSFPDTYQPIEGAKWGYIDTSGKVVVPLVFKRLSAFKNGFARTETRQGFGLVDREGFEGIPPQYRYLEGPDEQGHVKVCTPYWMGMCDTQGNEVIEPKYKHLDFFSEGMARGYRYGKCCWVDLLGKEHAWGRYQKIEDFHEGRAAFLKDGKWGYVDKEMNEVVPAAWDYAGPFSQGFAVVRSAPAGKYGYIDTNGKVVFAEQFTRASAFSASGHAVVYTGRPFYPDCYDAPRRLEDKAYYIIDKQGNDVFKRRFYFISDALWTDAHKPTVYDGTAFKLLAKDGTLEAEPKELERLPYIQRVCVEIAKEPDTGRFENLDIIELVMLWHLGDDGP